MPRHNWRECPAHIEVVELVSVIRLLAKSEDCDGDRFPAE